MCYLTNLHAIIKSKINITHLIVAAIVTGFVAVGLYFLGIIIGWTCCQEPGGNLLLFSNKTWFIIQFTNLVMILIGLFLAFIFARKNNWLDYQKTT